MSFMLGDDLSTNSTGSQDEDWDRSSPNRTRSSIGQLNAVVFPAEIAEKTPGKPSLSRGKRSLSELLKSYGEKGSDFKLSAEDATRLADVLGQWINSESSPYEADDDFFARSQDDLQTLAKCATNQEPLGRASESTVVGKT